MKRVEFQWKRGVFEQIRRLPGVEKELKKVADSVARAAGDGYESSLGDGKTRSRASVLLPRRRLCVTSLRMAPCFVPFRTGGRDGCSRSR